MAYDTEPDEEYVPKFAERMREQWSGGQGNRDEDAFALYDKMKRMEAADIGGQDAEKPPLKALRTGFAGIVIDRDTAVISVPPGLHIPTVGNTVQEQRHVSRKLEPWLQAAWKRAQVEAVWERGCKDLRVYGRAWSNVMVLPRLWSEEDEEYAKLVAALLQATASGDSEKQREAKADLEEFKLNNFPIRWSYVDARICWPQLSKERHLPEVVELRSMSLAEIAADYGEDALPSGVSLSGGGGKAQNDVYIYSNWVWTATVIAAGRGATGVLARKWRHNMKRSPYVLIEANVLPDNDLGIRWKSSLYDYMDMIEGQDGIMTDALTLHRRFTVAQPHIKVDAVKRIQGDATQIGPPESYINYDPNKPYVSWSDEDVGLMPTPALNQVTVPLLQEVRHYNETMTLNPVELGRQMSGQSGVGFTTALQAAQMDLGPYVRELSRGAAEIGDLFFRSVVRFSEEYPDAPDEIFVVHGKMGKLGVTAKDVKGWGALIQARSNIMLPINRNAMMDLAIASFEKLPLPPRYALEEMLQIENWNEWVDEWKRWRIELALENDRIEKTRELAGLLMDKVPAGSLAELAQRIAALPPAAQQALLAAAPAAPQAAAGGPGPGTVPGSAGAAAQAASNRRREGIPQAPSATEATRIMPTGVSMQ